MILGCHFYIIPDLMEKNHRSTTQVASYRPAASPANRMTMKETDGSLLE